MIELPEWTECRVCGKRGRVAHDGRFAEHRIVRARCPGGGQFVQRWLAQRERRAVASVAARWSA